MVPLALGAAGVYATVVAVPLVPWYGWVLLSVAAFVAWFKLVDADWTTYLYDALLGPDPNRISSKVVWIIGASSGIGADLARQYAAAGAQVILSARREDELRKVAASCTNTQYTPIVSPMDVLDFASHEAAFQRILTQCKRLDVCVLNAGRTQRSLAEDTSLEVTRQMLELNVFSQINLAQVVLPTFLDQRAGTFLVTSSVAGKSGVPISSSYAASKHALHGYFDSLRLEVADRGVDVCLSCPGPVATPIETAAFCESIEKKMGQAKEDLARKMPSKRCARLMMTQASRGITESWISQSPVLLFMYVAQYAPAVMKAIATRTIGPARVRMFRQGGDVYSMKAFFGGSSTPATTTANSNRSSKKE